MGDLSRNFSRAEVRCSCGCGNDAISPALVALLQEIRDIHGAPITITSGVRCEAHNASIGGVDGSAHVPADLDDGEGEVGRAVDIRILDSHHRFMLLPLLWSRFRRIGVGAGFVHVDTDPRKPQDVAWEYSAAAHQA